MSNEGKQVKVHYVGTLDDGTKFDSSRDRGEPLAFTCMAGQMIPGFDAAVRDMEVGSTVTIRLEPEDAYGPRRMEMVQTIPLAQLPGAEGLAVGQRIMLRSATGQPIPATVTDKDDRAITFDMNHEMAGKALTFEIELLEVSDDEEEHHCCHGHGHGHGRRHGDGECCHGEGRKHHEDGECCHGEGHGDGECCHGEGDGCCCDDDDRCKE
jgi:FKBP-type peptidyl-prolyl cis-trans isomerase 2